MTERAREQSPPKGNQKISQANGSAIDETLESVEVFSSHRRCNLIYVRETFRL